MSRSPLPWRSTTLSSEEERVVGRVRVLDGAGKVERLLRRRCRSPSKRRVRRDLKEEHRVSKVTVRRRCLIVDQPVRRRPHSPRLVADSVRLDVNGHIESRRSGGWTTDENAKRGLVALEKARWNLRRWQGTRDHLRNQGFLECAGHAEEHGDEVPFPAMFSRHLHLKQERHRRVASRADGNGRIGREVDWAADARAVGRGDDRRFRREGPAKIPDPDPLLVVLGPRNDVSIVASGLAPQAFDLRHVSARDCTERPETSRVPRTRRA